MVTHINADLDQTIGARAEGAGSYTEALRALLAGFVHYCAEQRAEMHALREIENSGGTTDRGDPVTELADMLREGQEHREFREFDPHLMAVVVHAALSAVPGQLYTHPETDVGRYAMTEIPLLPPRHRVERRAIGWWALRTVVTTVVLPGRPWCCATTRSSGGRFASRCCSGGSG